MTPVEGWSESRFWSFIRSALRKAFQRFPNKYKVVAKAKRGKGVYECAGCAGEYRNKDVTVDHILPCGSLKSFSDIPAFCEKLFCSVEGLQLLCKECHYDKTMKERGMTEEDIKVAQFKKLKANYQKAVLIDLGIEPASNQEKRVAQYRDFLL